MSLKEYLHRQGFSVSTQRNYGKRIDEYESWLDSWEIDANQVQYEDLLSLLETLEKKGLGNRSRQSYMTVLRHYYRYLIAEKLADSNPALGLHVKSRRLLPNGLLEEKELSKLYESYSGELMNRAILGLIIFQAIRAQELALLKLHHLQLRKTTLSIPACGRHKARSLSLEAGQVLDLQELAYERQNQNQDYLLASLRGNSRSLNMRLHKLYKELRQLNPKVRNGDQLRQSRIAHWLKHHNLRQVQHWAGHRYISSTERYQQTNTEELEAQLKIYHPRS